MFSNVCASERQANKKEKEVREREKFFGRKKGKREEGELCQEQILILSCNSPTCPPLSLLLLLPLSLDLPLPRYSFPPSPRSRLFDLFSLQILQLFYSLPCQCLFQCVECVWVRKPSRRLFFFKPLWCTTAPWGELFSPLSNIHTHLSYAPALTYFSNTSFWWSLVPSSLSVLNHSCPVSLTHFHYNLRHRHTQKISPKIPLFSVSYYTLGYFNHSKMKQALLNQIRTWLLHWQYAKQLFFVFYRLDKQLKFPKSLNTFWILAQNKSAEAVFWL